MTRENGASAAVQATGLAPENAGRLARYADHLQGSPLPGHRALEPGAGLRYLRVAEAWPGARDRAIALLPLYAGVRVAEIRALDVANLRLSAGEGEIHLVGKGGSPGPWPCTPCSARGWPPGWKSARPCPAPGRLPCSPRTGALG